MISNRLYGYAALVLSVLSILACNLFSGGPAAQPPTLTPLPQQTDATAAPTATAEAGETEEPAPPVDDGQGGGGQPAPQQPASNCPAPAEASLPAAAPTYANTYTVVQNFLASGGSAERLTDRLTEWGMIVDTIGGVYQSDLTGDGLDEVIVSTQAPAAQFPNMPYLPGDVWIYTCVAGSYDILYTAFSEFGNNAPIVRSVEDINGDGRGEVVFERGTCGAHTCMVDIYALVYDVGLGQLQDVLDEGTGTLYAGGPVPSGTSALVDGDRNGTYEIVVMVGAVGSVGAGPQRTYENTFAWNGGSYELIDSQAHTMGDQEWPIHILMDGDALGEAGEYEAAIARYADLIGMDPAPVWAGEDVDRLYDYARYRMMLMYALLGDEATALLVHDALLESGDPTDPSPQNGFVVLADMFWREYTQNMDIAAACQMVNDYAGQHPDGWNVLNQFGYANRLYEAADMCPYG